LILDHPADFSLHSGSANYAVPLLEDFRAGDSVDLQGIGINGLNPRYDASTGMLQITSSSGGIMGSGSFQLTPDSGNVSLLTRS
jgi:hypothetical protein